MKLRPYQIECVEAISREFCQQRSTLVVMATGTGKGPTLAEVCRRMLPKRSICLAHRSELIHQLAGHLNNAGLATEIEMAHFKADHSMFSRDSSIVASVQTMISGLEARRMEKFKPEDFGLVVIDECHHGTSGSYRAIIDHFKANPKIKILGATATPDRADEEALGQIFETVAYDYDLENAIADGWLCDIEQHMVHINGLDYSQCRTTAGDLNGADLAQVMESESNLQGMAGATLDLIGTKRKTIVFTASVRQAEQTNNIFNRYHPGSSGWVHGAMPAEERNQTIRDFRSDKLQILVNVGVCLEGFDAPQTEVVVMGAATKSRARYTQAVGRATRPLPFTVEGVDTAEARRAAIKASAKPIATVLDFVGNSGRHKLVSALDILGGNYSEETVELAKRLPQQGRSVRESLADAYKEMSQRIARAKQDEEARKARLVAKVKFTVKRIDPFSAFDLTPAPERAWDRGKQLTEKQKMLLLKLGVDPNQLTYSQGRQLLNEQFRRFNNGLCTMKQASLLKKYGYDTHDITMKEASIMIDRIAANGWKRPVEESAYTN